MSKISHCARVARPRAKDPASAAIANCAEETQLITAYLDGGLDPRLAHSFEQHLSGCRDCKAVLRTYKKTMVLTRSFLGQQAASARLRFADICAAALAH